MHSFWNLFKAEFAADILSKILFSGRFPRFVGIFIFLVVVSWLIFWGMVKILYRIARWSIITESMTVKNKLNATVKVGTMFGDTSEPIVTSQNHWKLKLMNPNFRSGISYIEFLVEKQTGRLRIFFCQNQELVEIPYSWLRQIIPVDAQVNFHVDFTAYIYYQLRLNYL